MEVMLEVARYIEYYTQNVQIELWIMIDNCHM